jgi:predicted GNAT family N-acyltransferase
VGVKRITLHGQVSAKKFYESCGYHQCSDEVFIEENIEHVHMAKDLDPSPHNREVQFLSRL